eukprot:Gb_06963 [translate_table: standard]
MPDMEEEISKSVPADILKKKKKTKKKSKHLEDTESKWINCLPWNDANPDDPFSVLVGSNEGGLLSLEEIDEDAYNLGQKESSQTQKSHLRLKKRKRAIQTNDREQASESSLTQEDDSNQGLVLEPTAICSQKKKKKKKKRKRKKKKTMELKFTRAANNHPEVGQDADTTSMDVSRTLEDSSIKDNESDLSIDEEISAWKELRLHPSLEKAIWALKFKEPTPIQKMCIPAAAHQGKDVIGAAETGSGKTLAFGLPILQRLLEEQDKAARKEGLTSKEETTYKGDKCGSPLRALVVTPTRELALQVCDHLKAVAKFTNIRVVPIVGGIASQKQERFLKQRPHIVVGTPGRLWELMAGGESHLVELHSLSFFVLDEADRMIEKGHFRELQSIIDMLPAVEDHSLKSGCFNELQPLDEVNHSSQRKRRQTFVFSATIALTAGFRKKLKRGSHGLKAGTIDGNLSLATLSERAGVRDNAAIADLTSASIVAHQLEESVIECREEDKDAYLYYILKVHGCGRTIVFCTSIAALRRISAILRILKVSVWPLHAQMQQRARLKAMDRFRENENCVLVATDVAARGLDIPGVRTVIHYQLPHSAEVYIHRSGRTARASSDGCSIALISPSDRSKFISLCHSFSKDGLPEFPVNGSYMPEVEKRLSIARQIDRISRKNSQNKAERSWLTRNAGALEMDLEDNDSDREENRISKPKKAEIFQAKQLQQELDQLLLHPLQPKSLSHRFVAGAGMSTLLQQQLQEFTSLKQATSDHKLSNGSKKHRFLVIGEEAIEPLAALRNSKM